MESSDHIIFRGGGEGGRRGGGGGEGGLNKSTEGGEGYS